MYGVCCTKPGCTIAAPEMVRVDLPDVRMYLRVAHGPDERVPTTRYLHHHRFDQDGIQVDDEGCWWQEASTGRP